MEPCQAYHQAVTQPSLIGVATAMIIGFLLTALLSAIANATRE